MTEYFIEANSFASPFFSDPSSAYVIAESPRAALEKFAREYSHPAGLYAARCYESADAMHKGAKVLASWLSNHARVKEGILEREGGGSYLGDGSGRFRINGTWHTVGDPKGGSVEDAE